MLLNDIDADLLEFLTLSEPWSMVCGEFCPRYGSVEALVVRLVTFEHAEYVQIVPDPGAPVANAQVLLADATANGLYEDVVVSDCPGWMLTATDKGFAEIRPRLNKQ